jgi:hypothetical protein
MKISLNKENKKLSMRTRSESWPTGGSIRVVGVSEATICEMTHVTNLTLESRNEKEHRPEDKAGKKMPYVRYLVMDRTTRKTIFSCFSIYNSVCVWGEIPQVQ